MRLGAVLFLRTDIEANRYGIGAKVLDWARRVEAAEFDGIWVPDSIGRGYPTLDPLALLSAFSAVTDKVELGAAVLQVPLRAPVELAYRVQSLNALAHGRLRLGVGAGSTQADFKLVGADFPHRFRTLTQSLETMRTLWRGEPVNGASLPGWPDVAPPPVFLGAWRMPHWIAYAAEQCQGWIASGLYSSWADLESGLRLFRKFGGKRAILANVPVDLRDNAGVTSEMRDAPISLVCDPESARERLMRIGQLGFDDVLLIVPPHLTDQLESIRGLL